MSQFDKDLARWVKEDKAFAEAFNKFFLEEPLQTQLALIRRRRHLSQEALAKKVHMPQPQIARLERPSTNPSLSTLEKIAKALKCRLVLVPAK